MRILASSLVVILLGACGATPGTRPDDMTAVEHRAEARRHDRQGRAAPYYRGSYWGGGYWGHGGPSYVYGHYPWGYYWDSGSAHYGVAQEHEDAAAIVEKRYRDACGLVDPKAAPVSPFARLAKQITPIDNGVVLRLALEAGPPDVLLAEIQCHSAWLRLAPRTEAARDICALKGLEYMVRAEPDAIAVTITSRDPQLLPELRRRAELLLQPGADRTSHR